MHRGCPADQWRLFRQPQEGLALCCLDSIYRRRCFWGPSPWCICHHPCEAGNLFSSHCTGRSKTAERERCVEVPTPIIVGTACILATLPLAARPKGHPRPRSSGLTGTQRPEHRCCPTGAWLKLKPRGSMAGKGSDPLGLL